MKWDRLYINARLATMRENFGAYGAIESAALGTSDGRIMFAGPMRDLPGRPNDLAREISDAGNHWITPGLIDCHTHLVFAGNRATEFEMRLQGQTYEEIARAGGGIMSTVRATRAATQDELTTVASHRLKALAAEGVTTVEIKSGYGLDAETEIRLLRAVHHAGREASVRTVATFLGLHALPAGVDRAAFVAEMTGPVLARIAQEQLATAVDAFCENIAFTPDETATLFEAATRAGLRVKLHADQLSDTGGAGLAARFNALSADHLEYANEEGIAAMARAGTVAVMLPAAFFFLRETKLPPMDLLRKHKVPLAVATDCNPGTAPVVSLLSAMTMAATLFRMTPEEVLAGVTRNAARALGLEASLGTLEHGKQADFAIWPVAHPSELSYWIGGLRPLQVVAAVQSGA
jgi:imidazolonepropionase